MASKASKYQILRMEKIGTPPFLRMAGKPYVFDDPAEAATFARQLSRDCGEKMCVKPVLDGKWRDREFQKLHDGTYRKLPWDISGSRWWFSDAAYAIWKDHYPHASLEKPGWIAYTKSEEDGEKDKQSLLRPGAYLNRYFGTIMHDHGIGERGRVEEFMRMYGPIDIKFATTEQEIVKVYENGPRTCMNDKRWPKNTHPASIYAAGDLQVAYLGDLDSKVSARVLVWPEKKTYSRIYGDIARLTQGLQRLDYKWGAPIGAKLKRIELSKVRFDGHHAAEGCFLAPYIDKQNQAGGGHLSVKDCGDHLVICKSDEPGSHHAGQASGVTGLYVPRKDEYPTFTCGRCGKQKLREVYPVLTENPEEDDDGVPEMWCQNCTINISHKCAYSGNRFSPDIKMVTVDDRNMWVEYYANMYAARCEGNGKLYSANKLKEVWFPDGTRKYLSQRYITDHLGNVFESGLTQRCYPTTQMVTAHNTWGGFYAAKCELQKHTFQCDGCDQYWTLETRFQTHKDDRLYCETCDYRIRKYHETPISKSRKAFEKERTPLQAAE